MLWLFMSFHFFAQYPKIGVLRSTTISGVLHRENLGANLNEISLVVRSNCTVTEFLTLIIPDLSAHTATNTLPSNRKTALNVMLHPYATRFLPIQRNAMWELNDTGNANVMWDSRKS